MAAILVFEITQPSCVPAMFEWSVLRFWGKSVFRSTC
ncbi:Acyltransferase [Phytophthora megakarya]|uniref:Acyltransferase n=1 Tax=Phytophthora megakarya TaxID=4795 RepID=A0A225WNH1_9STRA|nr:Acyltransferase [Phytophthora megakarya]